MGNSFRHGPQPLYQAFTTTILPNSEAFVQVLPSRSLNVKSLGNGLPIVSERAPPTSLIFNPPPNMLFSWDLALWLAMNCSRLRTWSSGRLWLVIESGSANPSGKVQLTIECPSLSFMAKRLFVLPSLISFANGAKVE